MSWHQATTLEKLADGPTVFKRNRRQIALFLVEDDEDCVVRPEAAKLFAPQDDDIQQAADDCPVEVIQVERSDA